VEVTKLVEEITTVADTIRNTMFNANDWHFFDGRPYTSLPSPPWPEPHLERWEYRAERSNEMWVVNVRYHAVGTESIMHPPRYQILLKDGDEFKEIREVFY
jgi:hypothetical protein